MHLLLRILHREPAEEKKKAAKTVTFQYMSKKLPSGCIHTKHVNKKFRIKFS
jgi:hypothetical protein